MADVKIRLALDGAGQVQAGVQGVGQALGVTADQAIKLETASAQLAVTQQRLEAATAKNAAAQAALAKAAKDSATSQEQLARLQQQAASAAANQQLASARAAEAVQGLQKLQAAHIGVTQATKLTGNQTAQLSAQLQDLFVQIQAGGSPMTALIQQGSQLSAVFGGTGNALRAVASLFSPVVVGLSTIAAVGIVAGVAYLQITKEQEAFRKGLVLTGNAAGVTVGQLNDMARAQAAVAGSQGKAAEVLAALAATGNVSRAQLAAATDAAIQLERVGGPAVEATIKKFDELGRSPLQALTKLNEAERFLTKEIVDQVAALEMQGRTAEAAAVAQDAYARTITQRSSQLAENLGLLERAWQGVGDKAKAAWNAILNIGRPEGTGTQLQAVNAQIAAAEARIQEARNARPGTMLGGQANLQIQRDERILEGLRAQAASLEDIARLEQRSATAQAERAQAGQIAARWAAEEVKLLSPKKQLELEIQRIQREGLQIGAKREDIERRIAKAREDAAKKVGGTGKTEEQRQLEREAEALEKAVGLSGRYYKDLQDLNSARARGALVGEAYADAVVKLTNAQPFAVKLAKEEAESIKQVADAMQRGAQIHAAYINELERSAAAAAGQVQSLQDEERAAAMAANGNLSLAQALQEVAIARLQEQRIKAANDPEALAAIDAEIAKRRELITLIGSKEAREANKRSAEEMARDWQRVSDQVGQSLSDALMQGGKSAAEYIKGLFRQMVLRPLLQPLVQPIAGLIAGAMQGTQGGATPAGGMSGASGTVGMLQQAYSAYSNYGTALSAALFGNSAAYGGVLAQGAATGAGSQAAMLAAQTQGFGLSGLQATQSAAATATGYTGTTAGTSSANAAWGAYWPLAIVAGMMASSDAFKQGFNENSLGIAGQLNPLLKARTNLWEGLFGQKTANIITGASLTSALFGRAAPRLESTELVGSFTGGDFTGNLQANILEKGGLFRSDKRSTQTSALSSDLEKALDESGKQLADLAKKYGQALGLPVNELASVNQTIKVKLTDDAKDNAKAIEEALQQYSDALLKGFSSDLEPLRKSGETLSQTIERVGGALLGVNESLKLLGLGALEASVAGGDAATQLADLFGGINNLASATGDYYQRFYSDAERAARATDLLAEEFTRLGVAMPQSRDAFRAMVEAQDLTTDSGRQTFSTLLSLAGAFDDVSRASEAAAEKVKAERAALDQAIAGTLPKFLTEMERNAFAYQKVAADLAKQGVAVSVESLMSATKDEILTFARSFVSLETNSQDAKLAVISAADALADLKDNAQGVADGLRNAIDGILPRILTPAQLESQRYARASDQLTGLGLNFDAATLKGASAQSIIDFARAFVLAAENSDQAKTALIGIVDSLLDLKDAAAEAARLDAIKGVEGQLKTLRDTIGDTSVIDTFETVSQAFVRNRSELEQLETGLSRLLGTTVQSAQEALAELLQTQKALDSYRSGTLGSAITDARLRSLDPSARVSELRRMEGDLFGQLATSADPVATAQRLQAVVLQRIKEEAALRNKDAIAAATLAQEARDSQIKALREQITGAERLFKLAQDMAQLTGSLRFSDLSPLAYDQQLGAAQNLFDTTLTKAQAGDVNAQSQLGSNAQAYLQEARSFYASSPEYAAIFARVTGALDSIGAGGAQTDLSVLQQQLAALEAMKTAQIEEQNTAGEELAALLQIDAGLALRSAEYQTAIDKQTEAAKEQIQALRDIVAEQRAQIAQAAEATKRLEEQLKKLNETTTSQLTLATLEAERPTERTV